MNADTSQDKSGDFAEFLANSRLEVIPLKNLQKQLDQLPQNSEVTVTCSPSKGLDKTLEITEQLRKKDESLKIVPHIAARMVESERHLDDILKELERQNVTDLFLPGGDIESPAGEFSSSLELLKVLSKKDHSLQEIGVTAYPEGHPLIETDVLYEALQEKQEYAHYMITQMCFDHETILNWFRDVRQRGVTMPAYIGIPGAVDRKKLLEISLKLGIGQSVSFLRKNMSLVKTFLGGSLAATTDGLLQELLPACSNEELNVRGFHIYTFNQIGSTVKWWEEKISAAKKGESITS